MELHRKSEFSEFYKLLLRDFTLQHRSYFLSIPLALIDEHDHEYNEEVGNGNGAGNGVSNNGGSGANNGNSSANSSQNGFFGIHQTRKNSTTLRNRFNPYQKLSDRLRKSPKQDVVPLSSTSSNASLNMHLTMDFRSHSDTHFHRRIQRQSKRLALLFRQFLSSFPRRFSSTRSSL